jgi:hypothetical protein
MKAVKASLAKSLDRPDHAIRFYLFHGADASTCSMAPTTQGRGGLPDNCSRAWEPGNFR